MRASNEVNTDRTKEYLARAIRDYVESDEIIPDETIPRGEDVAANPPETIIAAINHAVEEAAKFEKSLAVVDLKIKNAVDKTHARATTPDGKARTTADLEMGRSRIQKWELKLLALRGKGAIQKILDEQTRFGVDRRKMETGFRETHLIRAKLFRVQEPEVTASNVESDTVIIMLFRMLLMAAILLALKYL